MANLMRRPNSRQIPYSSEYTVHKVYNDLLYGYLQSISLPGEDGIRYVNASEVSYTKLATALDMSPPTVKKYFIGLQELYLVGLKKYGKFELLLLANEYSMLVPNDVLEVIIGLKQRYALSLYVKFLSLSGNKNQIEYNLTAMKNYLGLSSITYSNSHIVTEALDNLQRIGLLEHRRVTAVNETGRFVDKQYVTNLVNYLGVE